MRESGVDSVYVPYSIDFVLFARYLSKIAHSFICGWIGADAFEPFLKDFILGQAQEFPYGEYVGADIVSPPPEDGPTVPGVTTIGSHKITPVVFGTAQDGQELVGTTIRLFTSVGKDVGPPLYHVIVGRAQAGLMLTGTRPSPICPKRVGPIAASDL